MMKKLLMMSAIAAMAFGAQAMTYAYWLTLQDVPLSSLENVKGIKCYLVDSSVSGSSVMYGNKGAVMAEFTFVDLNKAEGGTTVKSVNYNTIGYDVSGNQKSSGGLYATEDIPTAGYIGQVTFKTAENGSDRGIDWNYMGKTSDDVKEYAEKNLMAYLVVTTEDESMKQVTQEFSIKVTANNSNVALGSTATYQQVIPEPTSGMLVFLGLAGLMLKRKRAA